MPDLSVVVPVYFNEDNLPVTYVALKKALDELKSGLSYELIFVDDGSEDRSFDVLKELRKTDQLVKIIRLARNFGSQMAIWAGMKSASGKCVGCISADLQEPPELIVRMYEEWQKGFEVVIAAREDREDGWINKLFSNLFYSIFRLIVSKDMPKYGYDLFLVDRKVVAALARQRLNNVGLIGQILQLGYRRTFIYYVRQKREIGESKFTFAKKVKLALDNIINFSYFPLRFMSLIGFLASVFAFLFAFYTIINKLVFGVPVMGYATIVVLISFFSGLILSSLGVLGEYIWRILDVARNSAEFLIQEKIGFAEEERSHLKSPQVNEPN